MIQTIKDFFDEILVLPKAVKIAVVTVLLFAIGFAVFFGVKNAIGKHKIERLERENFELSRSAQDSMEKAAKAEESAANEALRAQSLESEIKTLEAKGNTQDEKIYLQTQKSVVLRNDLNRVRVSSPANVGTDELERRLKARYGQAERPQ